MFFQGSGAGDGELRKLSLSDWIYYIEESLPYDEILKYMNLLSNLVI